MEKNKKDTLLVSLKKENGEYTTTVEETIRLLLNSLIPDEDMGREDEEQRRIRENVERYRGNRRDTVNKVEIREVRDAINKMRNKRAPGKDGIKVEIIKELSDEIEEEVRDIVDKILKSGIFPERWKEGIIKIFLKADNKPRDQAKSYRPVTLLPVLGKFAERVIAHRLMLEIEDKIDHRQHGFMKGRGTRTALNMMKIMVHDTGHKYVMGIFADIAGAFDNAWHDRIVKQLMEWECSTYLVKVIKNYLKGRKVELKIRNSGVRKEVTKGCPQGSILGPILWNILFNSIFQIFNKEWENLVVYADDATIIVKGNNRKEIEERMKDAAERLWEWGRRNRLAISEQKTVAMLLREKLVNKGKAGKKRDKERLFVVRMGNRRLTTVRRVKCLGVIIGERMRFEEHLEYVKSKVEGIAGKLKREMRVNGVGLSTETYEKMYRGVLEPIMLHGVEFWGVEVYKKKKFRDRIRGMQRRLLLQMTAGYRTVSHEAIRVIAGVEPIDLKIEAKLKIEEDMRDGMDKEESRERRMEEMMDRWQDEWNNAMKGRATHRFCPDIRKRIREKWKTDYHITQALSGHGNFKGKLHRFGLVNDGMCTRCNVEEDYKHVIFNCVIYDEDRFEVSEMLQRGDMEMTESEVMRPEVREAFFRMVRKIGRRKEELEESLRM